MVIKNARIVLSDRIIENGYIEIENGLIKSINEGKYSGSAGIFDAKGNVLMPGFIDIHTHGCAGIDFMNIKSKEDLLKIQDYLLSEGVTSFLATTLTSDMDSLSRVCRCISESIDEVPCLKGIHLEGPYISKLYKGAQNEEYIRNPNINELRKLIKDSNENIRYITLAPEIEGSKDFISLANEEHITISCGHSAASFETVKESMRYGLSGITHTTNGMDKKSGIVDAAKELDLFTEFICDGIHVDKETLKKYYDIIGPERFIAVTDSLSVKGTDVSELELFGLKCTRKDNALYLQNGKLAGSLLSMNQAAKNLHDWFNLSFTDISKVTSKNPAKLLHFKNVGEIKDGFLADLILINDNFEVINVFKNGIQMK